jgi:hypothetical protein
MVSFHPAFGLRAVGGNDFDAQAAAGLPEMAFRLGNSGQISVGSRVSTKAFFLSQYRDSGIP